MRLLGIAPGVVEWQWSATTIFRECEVTPAYDSHERYSTKNSIGYERSPDNTEVP